MITLFEYQQIAFELIIKAFMASSTALVVMATGLGKTIIAAFWARTEIKKKRKGLFLCHDGGILDQSLVEFRRVLGNSYSLKTFYGDKKDWRADEADIVFASFQTLLNCNPFHEDEFDFIIVDESHHGQAPTFKEVIQYFKPKKLLGITATPDRMDLKDIREIFGNEIVNYSLEEAIAKGWLTQIEYHILNDNLSHWKLKKILQDVLEKGERVSIKQLNETIFIQKRDEEIAKTIHEFTGSTKKAIIFCEKIDHAENFQQVLADAGIESLTYHSKVKGGKKELRKRLNAFREGSLQYILAIDKFNEGIDIPDAEVIVFLRCTDSATIFYQQLGRGLRKVFGKEKVSVLDFVANCERLAMVKEMAFRIKEFTGNHFMLSKELLHVSGNAFDFAFSDEQVDILDLIKRINTPFCSTWQEASAISMDRKFSNIMEYRKGYRGDPRLPSSPHVVYPNFPGWRIFLGKRDEFYINCADASKSAINLKLESIESYQKGYKADPKLISCPDRFYSDFPGWKVFLGKDKFYKTWQEASNAVKKLNIFSIPEYRKERVRDSKLHGSPNTHYKDFPGWAVFLGKDYYKTWQGASIAAIKLGAGSGDNAQKGYSKVRRQDPKLHSHPDMIYSDFPGWPVFLGKVKKEFYETWQEASVAAINLGFGSHPPRKYRMKYKSDPKLPSDPDKFYKDFPGWDIFLGKKK